MPICNPAVAARDSIAGQHPAPGIVSRRSIPRNDLETRAAALPHSCLRMTRCVLKYIFYKQEGHPAPKSARHAQPARVSTGPSTSIARPRAADFLGPMLRKRKRRIGLRRDASRALQAHSSRGRIDSLRASKELDMDRWTGR